MQTIAMNINNHIHFIDTCISALVSLDFMHALEASSRFVVATY